MRPTDEGGYMRQRVFVLAVLAALLAACGGGSGTRTSPLAGCTSVAPPTLLYPAAGATGIAATNLQLYFGYGQSPSVAWSAPILAASGSTSPTLTGGAYTPSNGPLPPSSTPLPPGDQLFVSGVSSAAAATTYLVTVTNTLCQHTFAVGTFTTQ